jgi:hypothetical protein
MAGVLEAGPSVATILVARVMGCLSCNLVSDFHMDVRWRLPSGYPPAAVDCSLSLSDKYAPFFIAFYARIYWAKAIFASILFHIRLFSAMFMSCSDLPDLARRRWPQLVLTP